MLLHLVEVKVIESAGICCRCILGSSKLDPCNSSICKLQQCKATLVLGLRLSSSPILRKGQANWLFSQTSSALQITLYMLCMQLLFCSQIDPQSTDLGRRCHPTCRLHRTCFSRIQHVCNHTNVHTRRVGGHCDFTAIWAHCFMLLPTSNMNEGIVIDIQKNVTAFRKLCSRTLDFWARSKRFLCCKICFRSAVVFRAWPEGYITCSKSCELEATPNHIELI